MPLMNIKGIGGYLTSDQKKGLISKVTEVSKVTEAVLDLGHRGGRGPRSLGVKSRPITDADLRRLENR